MFVGTNKLILNQSTMQEVAQLWVNKQLACATVDAPKVGYVDFNGTDSTFCITLKAQDEATK